MLKYLSELADIVVNIDEGKNISELNVVKLTDDGIRLIAQMKQRGLDVGVLTETFAGMQLACGDLVLLSDMVDMAHEEIARLLGRDAWRIYGYHEGFLFCNAIEDVERVAA